MSLQRLPSREGIDAVTHAVPAEGSLTRTLAVLKVPFILAAIWKFQMNLTVYLSRILPPGAVPRRPVQIFPQKSERRKGRWKPPFITTDKLWP